MTLAKLNGTLLASNRIFNAGTYVFVIKRFEFTEQIVYMCIDHTGKRLYAFSNKLTFISELSNRVRIR